MKPLWGRLSSLRRPVQSAFPGEAKRRTVTYHV